jgi:Coatomer beta subunit appendage platform
LISVDRDIPRYADGFYFRFISHHSVFGEDALVNVSVEKKEDNDGKLAGYIRIRSKTQGIALSLGDRITSVQRGAEK